MDSSLPTMLAGQPSVTRFKYTMGVLPARPDGGREGAGGISASVRARRPEGLGGYCT